MMRILGGLVGLSICTVILHQHLESRLPGIITPQEIEEILKSTQALTLFDPSKLHAVRVVFAEAYDLQLRYTLIFAAMGFLCTIGIWWFLRGKSFEVLLSDGSKFTMNADKTPKEKQTKAIAETIPAMEGATVTE
jgi:hypothetical protein